MADAQKQPSSRPELPKQYKPSEHEPRVRERWETSRAFHADPARVLQDGSRPYAILIPPPNVTARLHLGHALNNTLQDVLARAHRMMGYETLWMPGTDHAGIATQTVVEKRVLAEEGKRRTDFKREDFVGKIQSFKDDYEAQITDQLKRMGCSCDWERQRFTMDEVCARAVNEAFFRLFRDGLIYRGKRLVNWDPVTQTALADDEVEMEEVDGKFYYLRYPLVHGQVVAGMKPGPSDDQALVPVTWSELRARGYPVPDGPDYGEDRQAFVTVATTRPETYLGDTAVAINPRDPRAKPLRGLLVELPLVGRIIPVIEDDYVVMPRAMAEAMGDAAAAADAKAEFATGFLKVTPAHDPNDFELGRKHDLALINIMAPDASISDKHGWTDVGDAGIFLGKGREEARKLVVKEFQARGLVEDIKPYRHSVGHSYRSHAAIEPYLSDQWYVRVTDPRLRDAALRAMADDQKTSVASMAAEVSDLVATGHEGRSEGDGALRIFPERYARTYETWHVNIRDWCISRQLWWGHQIPVWHKRCILDGKSWEHELSPPTDTAGGEGPTFGDLMMGEVDGVAVRYVRLSDGLNADPTRMVPLEPGLEGEYDIYVCAGSPDLALKWHFESTGFTRDPDVLDTWFSSALWPISTMGWPDPAKAPDTDGMLEAFNPTSVLCTAREIITLWVSRMVMFNRYFRGQDLGMGPGNGPLPFRDVFIHAMIMDGEGRKMSKSLGNGVDPLDIIDSHGSDAMRFVLCQMTTQTQDVRMPVEKDPTTGKNTSPKFDLGRNFANKLWNASRFAITILENPANSERASRNPGFSLPDRWMLSRLLAAAKQINAALESYQFSDYATALYDLLWRDFCDWYLEAIKPTVGSDPRQRAVLAHTLETIIRLLHPIAPFITEAISERLLEIETAAIDGLTLGPARTGGLLATAAWPILESHLEDRAAEADFERIRSLVTAVREVRAQHNIPPKRRITLHVPEPLLRQLGEGGDLVRTLAGLETITADEPSGGSVAFTAGSATCRLSNLADAVDAGAERARLEKLIAEREKTIATFRARLANPGYADKAPPHMVQQTRDQLAKAEQERDAAAAQLREFGA